MMIEEEAMIVSGLLVGLNVIDCNIGIKDEDLDQPVSDPIEIITSIGLVMTIDLVISFLII